MYCYSEPKMLPIQPGNIMTHRDGRAGILCTFRSEAFVLTQDFELVELSGSDEKYFWGHPDAVCDGECWGDRKTLAKAFLAAVEAGINARA